MVREHLCSSATSRSSGDYVFDFLNKVDPFGRVHRKGCAVNVYERFPPGGGGADSVSTCERFFPVCAVSRPNLFCPEAASRRTEKW